MSETEGILRRGSEPVPLGQKATEVLLILVRNAQSVVSRGELKKAVWPDIAVDENNLDQQIAALRRALGQGQNSSQVFVETVPRRGYRFLVKVTEEWDRPTWMRRLRLWLAVAVGVLLLVGAGWVAGSRIRHQRGRRGTVALRQSVAVLGFKNLAGGAETAWMSTALTEMLRAELSMAKTLRTISGEEVARTKLDLFLPDTDSLSTPALAAIRKNLAADLAVLGSYTTVGQGEAAQIRVDIIVQNAASGEIAVSISRTGAQSSLLHMVSEVGFTLRKELGEGELTASEERALKNEYPSNLEVERLYAEGLAKLRLLDAASARPLLEKAIAREPGYALPYRALADAWSILGYQLRAKESARKALDRASALPRESFLLIEGQFRELANESDRAIQIYRSLWTVFPDKPEYGLRLANSQTAAGKGKEAMATIGELRKLLGADDPRVDLAEAAAAEAVGDFAHEKSAASQAFAKAEARRARLVAAAALLRESWARNQMGDRKPALEAAEKAKAIYKEVGDRAGEARAWKNIADVLDDQGDSTAARDPYERALATFREIGHEAAASTVINNLAYVLMGKGELNGARNMFEESAEIGRKIGDRGREAIALNGVANVLWRQGDLVSAIKIYQDVVAIHRERGDRARMATVLGNVAIVLQDQGHLDEAKAKFEESLEIIRQIGDKPGLARTLGNLGELLLKQGDVSNAKKRFAEHLSVAEQMDDNRQRGYALFGLGEALLAEGDLAGARAKHEAALKVRVKMDAKGVVAESQLALAGVSLEEGKFEEAVQRSREACEQFHREREIDQEALAIAIEARGRFAQGRLPDAGRAAKRAKEFLPEIQDQAQRIAVLVTVAPVLAASSASTDVKAQLSTAETQATNLGYGALRLDVLLAESELDRGSVTATPRLQAVEREAKAKGLTLTARKAADLLMTRAR